MTHVFSEQVICEVDLTHNRLFMLYATLETTPIVRVSQGGKALERTNSSVEAAVIISALRFSSTHAAVR